MVLKIPPDRRLFTIRSSRERERENKGSRGITASEAQEADLNATSENRTEKQRKKS